MKSLSTIAIIAVIFSTIALTISIANLFDTNEALLKENNTLKLYSEDNYVPFEKVQKLERTAMLLYLQRTGQIDTVFIDFSELLPLEDSLKAAWKERGK